MNRVNSRARRAIRAFCLAALNASFAASLFAASPILRLPSHGDKVRLLVTGDTGGTHSRLTAGMLAVNKRTPIDAIILVGDNFYPCGVTSVTDKEWTKITEHFGYLNVPIFPILGNHDYGDPDRSGTKAVPCRNVAVNPDAELSATGKIAEWTFPARSYQLHGKYADIVMVDTEPIALGWSHPMLGSSTQAQQAAWLTSTLAGLSNRWLIVAGHHAIYSSGPHGNSSSEDSYNMRKLLPLLAAQHVDLYMCGHDHEMELIGNVRSHDPLFLVSGAGSDLYATHPRTDPREPPTIWPAAGTTPFYGFAILEISRSTMSIVMYDMNGKPKSDAFIVRK